MLDGALAPPCASRGDPARHTALTVPPLPLLGLIVFREDRSLLARDYCHPFFLRHSFIPEAWPKWPPQRILPSVPTDSIQAS